jgi:DNA-binding winged helix-turn-helix (wHTH) protein/Tol biopolymer transport system component
MSNKTLTLYKFDDFCLDTNQRCLLYADTLVSLTPKAYQTLLVLLQHRGEIVEKEFLLNEVWADTFVEETTLSQNILTLRKALRAFQKEKEFIVTFPRRGYRFVADVQEIVNDEEIIVVEKHTRTHIVAEQQQIHDSADTKIDKISVLAYQKSLAKSFLSPKHIGLGLVGILLVASGFFAAYYFGQLRGFVEPKVQKSRVDTLLSDTDIRNAVISPNGKYLAIVQVKDEKQSLLLRQIADGNTIEIVPKINGVFIGAVFSPNSEQIYYSVYEKTELNKSPIGTLYKTPILGGASQKILNNIDSPAAISLDKTRLAFIRRNLESKETALIIADIDGKNERSLATQNLDEEFTTAGVSWSPDGKLLSTTVNHSENNKKLVQVAVVDAETGEQKIISNQNWIWAGQTAWLKDGTGIVVAIYRETSPTLTDELWLVSYPNGNARYLTNGIKGVAGISLNSESGSIVAIKPDKLTCFLSASLDNFRKSNHISTRIGDACQFSVGADWTEDGKIVYSTAEGGNADIWTTSEDDSGKKQLTSDESAEILPQISKDGRFLIFLSNRSGQMNVWRANPDGTNQTQLTDNENVKDTIISPDGSTVFYLAQNHENTTETLWKISINGENKTQMTSRMTKSPRISPDGKTIACYFQNIESNKMSLTLISTETGEVLRYLETPPNDNIPFLDWAKDGENLFLILQQKKVFNIWKLSLNDSKAEKIREWENDAIFRFVISKNGERVFYEVGTEINSIVLFHGLVLKD